MVFSKLRQPETRNLEVQRLVFASQPHTPRQAVSGDRGDRGDRGVYMFCQWWLMCVAVACMVTLMIAIMRMYTCFDLQLPDVSHASQLKHLTHV